MQLGSQQASGPLQSVRLVSGGFYAHAFNHSGTVQSLLFTPLYSPQYLLPLHQRSIDTCEQNHQNWAPNTAQHTSATTPTLNTADRSVHRRLLSIGHRSLNSKHSTLCAPPTGGVPLAPRHPHNSRTTRSATSRHKPVQPRQRAAPALKRRRRRQNQRGCELPSPAALPPPPR